jgi:hypothetical protein
VFDRLTFAEHKKLTVVNMFAGPGCGKSTLSAGLFHEMKKQHYKVEMIPEWIKGEGIWENRSQLFGDQDYIFAHQHRMQRRLIGHDIDYVITDSPLMLGMFYLPKDFPQSFKPFMLDVVNSYDNLNIFIKRNDSLPYTREGRNQDLEEAIQIDDNIRNYFDVNDVKYCCVDVGDHAVSQTLSAVIQHPHCR